MQRQDLITTLWQTHTFIKGDSPIRLIFSVPGMENICIVDALPILLLFSIHGTASIFIVAGLPILLIYYILGMVSIFTRDVSLIHPTSYILGMASTSIKVDLRILLIFCILLTGSICIVEDLPTPQML